MRGRGGAPARGRHYFGLCTSGRTGCPRGEPPGLPRRAVCRWRARDDARRCGGEVAQGAFGRRRDRPVRRPGPPAALLKRPGTAADRSCLPMLAAAGPRVWYRTTPRICRHAVRIRSTAIDVARLGCGTGPHPAGAQPSATRAACGKAAAVTVGITDEESCRVPSWDRNAAPSPPRGRCPSPPGAQPKSRPAGSRVAQVKVPAPSVSPEAPCSGPRGWASPPALHGRH